MTVGLSVFTSVCMMQVIFPDGSSRAVIMLLITSDDTPELNEVTRVTLSDVVENGVPTSGDQTRGARLILTLSEAVITVQANDDPHGVVTWSPLMVMVEEEEGTDNVVQFTLVREFGTVGAIIVSYRTEMDMSVPLGEQAESLLDFIPASRDVVIGDGEGSANISVTILQVC